MMRTILLLLLAVVTASAQIGDKADKPGVVQKPLVPKELIPPAPALSPADALKSFKVAPGFRIELVASDPLVQDPVAMAIDPDGRIWVVEMLSYMPDLDGNHEDAPVGRVSILTDTNGDGKMDKKTVFLDKLVMPRAIMLVGGGALIGAPPKLWFCRDTNGDDVADEKIEVCTDYGVQVDPKRPELANPERAPNQPLWALDNWIYSAAYTTKLRYTGGTFEKGTTTFRGQWGLSQDDFGRLYYNSNSDQLRGDLVPSQYLGRNPSHPRPTGGNVKIPADQFVWPARVNPGINRGYRPEMLRDGKLKEFTAACSPYIYRGDLFPAEFYGNSFIAEPAGNLVKRNLMTEKGGTVSAREAYHQSEFLASTDERFRPVSFCTGPEGALYIVDLYRGVLQHRISLTSYLRKQSEDRGLDKPIALGRIYRIVPEGKSPVVQPRLSQDSPAKLVEYLSRPNSWWRETAQRLLVEKRDAAVVPALQKLATAGPEPLGRLHALWTLDGMGRLDQKTVEAALKDSQEKVRAAAVRLCEPFFKSEEKAEVLEKLLKLADDPSPDVQLQLALTLGEAREPAGDKVLGQLARKTAGNVYLRDAILSGLYTRELNLLEGLLADPNWSKPDAEADKFLNGLAKCVFMGRKADQVNRLLALIAAQTTKRQMTLLDGVISTALATARKPVKFTTEPVVLAVLRKSQAKEIQGRMAKVEPLMVWPGKPGVKPEPPVIPLTSAQQTRFENGKTLFAGSCAACHQLHGMGMEGLAPPLVDSEWVLGSEQRLARIVLHGVQGPLKVNGVTYSLDMPSMGVFDDEQLAGILTYIRREWEHTGAPVEAETVKKIRQANAARQEAWRQEDLLKVP
jgi:mono/diheme cytochrome c family protein/glucose/arabinose dehydrogenase